MKFSAILTGPPIGEYIGHVLIDCNCHNCKLAEIERIAKQVRSKLIGTFEPQELSFDTYSKLRNWLDKICRAQARLEAIDDDFEIARDQLFQSGHWSAAHADTIVGHYSVGAGGYYSVAFRRQARVAARIITDEDFGKWRHCKTHSTFATAKPDITFTHFKTNQAIFSLHNFPDSLTSVPLTFIPSARHLNKAASHG